MMYTNTLAVLFSACFVACWGTSLKYESNDPPEINLPGIMLPNFDSLLEATEEDPKPCCLPTKWQGNATSQSGWRAWRRRWGEDDVYRNGRRGRSGFRQQTVTVYVDEDAKKVAGRVRCCNDTCGFIVVFGANNTADSYLFKMGAQKCFHQKSDKAEFRKQCIPDNSTFEGSVKIGPAASGLGVQVWKYHGKPNHRGNQQPRVYVSGKAVVTGDKCLPVVFQDHGFFSLRPGTTDDEVEMDQEVLEENLYDDIDDSVPHKRPKGIAGVFMGSSFFTNVEPSIKDPSVFTPPSYCKTFAPGGNLQVDVDMEYPDILDRFVVLK